MDLKSVVDSLLDKAQAAGSLERSEHDKDYLKSDLKHFGMTVPDARKTAKWLLAEHPDLRAEPWALVEACWDTGVYDLRSIMSFYLERATLGPEAAEHLERLLARCHTWALVDQLAVQVVPRAKPDYATMSRWAHHDDFWLRRAALLADLKELRAGKGNPGRWANLAKPNLSHDEVFIAKAIGWVLREIGKYRPDWTAQFVEANKAEMSALSIREATRHLDE